MKWGYQDNIKPVYFLTERFCARKNTCKQTLIKKTKLSKHETTMATNFRAHKLLRGWKSLVLRLSAFCVFKTFSEKKIKRLETVLITSFHYTTDVYPYQPTYRASIYMHLFLFVNIYESFLIFRICDHLWEYIFLNLYKNKLVYEYHHLKQIFYHQNMIIIICWFGMFPFYDLCLEFFSFYVWVFSCRAKCLWIH